MTSPAALECRGAGDIIAAPRRPVFKAVVKNAQKFSNMYCFGPYSLDPTRRLLTRKGHAVPISARAFDVLLALVERAGHTVDKDELLRIVWPDTVVEEANLSQHIFMIRKLLGQTDAQPYIATVPRRGYQFVAPVENLAAATIGVPPAPLARIEQPVRLEMPLGPDIVLAIGATPAMALAPDGSKFAFIGRDHGITRVYVRRMDRFEATPLDGTDGASSPFFSPDGHWVGFEAGRRLHKISVDGGPPLALCDVADLRGATWTPGGEIVYAPGPTTGLWRIPVEGGAAIALTTLNFEGGERTHRWPHAVRDGSGVIFTIGSAAATSFDEAAIAMVSMAGGSHRLVLHHGTDGRSVGAGRLVWSRGAALFEAAFDAATARTGAPRVVQREVWSSATGVAHFDCSGNGTLIHVRGGAETLRRELLTVNRHGDVVGRHISGESLEEPRWSPDGAAAMVSLRNRSSDLWLYDFARATLGRLTFEGENFAGIWGPEPHTITFSASHGGPSELYVLRSDRSESPELLVSSEFDKVAGGWSPDGNTLVFTEYHPDTGADLWLLDRRGGRVLPFVRTRFNEYAPVFSPDGRQIAYVSDESGRAEIFVVSWPDATGKRQLSTDGGSEPIWSTGGGELFYRSGNRLMRIDVSAGVAHAGIPTTLFEGAFVPGTVTLANYDVSADAGSFLMVRAPPASLPATLRITLGWTSAAP